MPMVVISTALWQSFLPGGMPDGCTYEQFSTARDLTWREENLEWLANYLTECYKLYNTTKNQTIKQIVQDEITWAVRCIDEGRLSFQEDKESSREL